jgi:hypothetical protein
MSQEYLKLALEHSRALFIYSAGQRMLSLNYYFVAIAVFLSGFCVITTSSLTTGSRALSGSVLSTAGIILTICFWGLDHRNEMLVECSKTLLKFAEGEMANLVGRVEWNTAAFADNALSLRPGYRTIVPIIFLLYIILSAAELLFSIWPWATQLLCRCH